MPSNTEETEFRIQSFRPSKLKKAREALDRHVLRVEFHAETNEAYKKGVLKENSLWQKLTGLFKG
jgi:hypothetical protein